MSELNRFSNRVASNKLRDPLIKPITRRKEMSASDLTNEILENYKGGKTIDEITEKLGIGSRTVAHTLRDNKVKYKCPETGKDLNALKSTTVTKAAVGAGKK